ncbi:hypothetical protein ABTZ03_41055 [Kitasatospora sp. NPDC096077]
MPKYVASRGTPALPWAGSTLLGPATGGSSNALPGAAVGEVARAMLALG